MREHLAVVSHQSAASPTPFIASQNGAKPWDATEASSVTYRPSCSAAGSAINAFVRCISASRVSSHLRRDARAPGGHHSSVRRLQHRSSHPKMARIVGMRRHPPRRRPRIPKWRESAGCELLCLDAYINWSLLGRRQDGHRQQAEYCSASGLLSRHTERTDAQHG